MTELGLMADLLIQLGKKTIKKKKVERKIIIIITITIIFVFIITTATATIMNFIIIITIIIITVMTLGQQPLPLLSAMFQRSFYKISI